MEVSLPRVWESMAKQEQQQYYSKENSANKGKTKFLIEELISNKSPPKPKVELKNDPPIKTEDDRLSPEVFQQKLVLSTDKLRRGSPPFSQNLLQEIHSRSTSFPLIPSQPIASSIPVLHAWNGHSPFNHHVASAFPQTPFPFVQRFLTPEQQNMAWFASQSLNEQLHSRFLSSVPYSNSSFTHEGINITTKTNGFCIFAAQASSSSNCVQLFHYCCNNRDAINHCECVGHYDRSSAVLLKTSLTKKTKQSACLT